MMSIIGGPILRAFAMLSLCVLCTGCTMHAVPLRTRFDEIGRVAGPAQTRPSIVASAGEVAVYYGNAPEGFSLKENELKVEPSFSHVILGRILAEDARCTAVWMGCACHVEPAVTKETLLAQLQERAFQEGANAIIYAHSALPSRRDYKDDADIDNRCNKIKSGDPYASAWAVIVSK